MKNTLFILFLIATLFSSCGNKEYNLSSPDGMIKVMVSEDGNNGVVYNLSYGSKNLINNSALGFILKNGERIIGGKGWKVEEANTKSVSDKWYPIWGKRKMVDDNYNETTFFINNNNATLKNMRLTVRAYNDGIAFRYTIPEGTDCDEEVEKELTSFNFSNDYTAWFYNFENHNLGPEKLSETDTIRYPVMTIKVDDDCYMAVHEADLSYGEPLILSSKQGETSFSVVSKPARLKSGYKSSWRTILCGPKIGTLVDSHLLELLNPEADEKYDFKSWVKPGVAVWDWRINGAEWKNFKYGMNYESWIRMIDFASKNNIRYLVLDANWYGPEFESDSDPLKGDKANDVKRLIAYAKNKDVGIWLYLNDVGGRQYPLEETLKNYSKWGAVGIKYGFMNGNWEEKNIRTQMITRLWIAGPIDMNNGMFDLRQGPTTRVDENKPVPSTVVSEAARTLIVFSGATIIPDIPEYYQKYPELLKFISSQEMPWLESTTIDGEIGEYIVMMRQTDEAYLIGAATNEEARNLSINLDFLEEGREYKALIIEDGDGADYLTNRETLKSNTKPVKKNDTINVSLACGGGACILIE